ncbi:MAG TPA: hypothetical protein VNQ14_14840 [Woeseiaceae bacterium]|nr:hypothetical protein [Woeseiaceae bacterium]
MAMMAADDGVTDVAFAYDSRDRCIDIDLEGVQLAAYQWLGTQIHQRDTTCDYPGSTKPKFEMKFTRDGLGRPTIVDTAHVTDHMDQTTDSARLGRFQYSYDAASNPTADLATANMGRMEARRWYEYDTLNRLTEADLLDTQTWANPATVVIHHSKPASDYHLKTGHFEELSVRLEVSLSQVLAAGEHRWRTNSRWPSNMRLPGWPSTAGRIGGLPGRWASTVRPSPAM